MNEQFFCDKVRIGGNYVDYIKPSVAVELYI